jgi:hypothetical protein
MVALLVTLACGAVQAQSIDSEPFVSEVVTDRMTNGGTPLRLWHRTEGYGLEASETAIGGRGAFDFGGAVGFTDGQFRISNESRFGANVGGGFRWYGSDFLVGQPRIFGISGWYDGQETVLNNYFNQGGVSFESLGEYIDFRLNANIPFEDQKTGDQTFITGDLNFAGNSLSQATLTPTDVALRVVDFEIAPRVFDLNLWVYGGGYQMDGEGVSEMGAKIGFRGYVTNDLAVDVGVTDDEVFHTNTTFQIIWTPGRTGAGPTSWIHSLADRMREPVYRNTYIATQQALVEGSMALTNGAGQEFNIVHVNSMAAEGGDGTFERPFNNLTDINGATEQGAIILVHANSTFMDETATLLAQQRLLGEGGGNTHTITTSQLGTVTIPETFAGALNANRPTVTNNNTTDMVVLTQTTADASTFTATEVSNFDFFGGDNAISTTTGVGAVNINRLTIDGTASHAIFLTELTETLANGTTRARFSPTIDDVTFTNVGGDDIRLDATTAETTIVQSVAISDIESDDGEGVGINLIGLSRPATIQNFDWNGGTTGDGALRIANSTAQGDVTMSGTNAFTGGETGTPDTTGFAIALINNAGDLTVSGTNTTIINMGGDSVIVEGGAGSMNFTGSIVQNTNNASVLSVSGNHTGTLTFTERLADQGVIRATAGDGIQFNDANGTYTFNDEVEFIGTSQAVNAVGGDGAITFTNADFQNTTADTLTFNGGEMSMTLTGRITQANNFAVLSVTNGHDGTLVFNELTNNAGVISATNGPGLVFQNADGAYTFNDRVDLMGGDAHIDITAGSDATNGSQGTFTFADGNIVNPATSPAVLIDGSNVVFTYTGNIDATNNDAVVISDNVGGSVTFTAGTTIDSTFGIEVTGNSAGTFLFAGQVTLTGTENGVEILNNTGGSTTFNNIDITKTGAGTGFVATSGTAGHTVTVTGSGNTISTQTGVALHLDTIAVGGAGINFQSVSSDGANNGIIIDNVTGGAVNIGASGAALNASGTIANSVGAGVVINNAANVSINGLTVDGAGADGFDIDHAGATTSIVRINNAMVTNTTGSGIDYNRSASGLSRFTLTGSQINANGDTSVLMTINGSGTQDITINNGNQITNGTNDSALAITTGGGSKTTNILIDNNNFDNNDATAATVAITSGSSGTMNTTVTSNSFDNADTGRSFVQTSNSGTVLLDLNGNNATNAGATNEYLLNQVGGTFNVVDLATVDARNTGGSATPVDEAGTVNNSAGPVPQPSP